MAIPSRFELRALEEGRMTEDELLGKYGRDNILRALDLYEEEDNAAFPGYQDRMVASFATTPEGEASIYRQRGYNVDVTPEGLMATTDYGTRRVDQRGFDLSEPADMAGQSIPTLLGTLGSMLPGFHLPGAVFGEMTGEGIRQGLGNLAGSGEGVNVAALAEAGLLGAGGVQGCTNHAPQSLGGPGRRTTGRGVRHQPPRTVAAIGYDREQDAASLGAASRRKPPDPRILRNENTQPLRCRAGASDGRHTRPRRRNTRARGCGRDGLRCSSRDARSAAITSRRGI